MKTFDLAVHYLKGFDYTIDPYKEKDRFQQALEGVVIRFKRDPDCKFGNEYYRMCVLEVAYHHCFELVTGIPSNFEAACKIIGSEKHILTNRTFFGLIPPTYERWGNTIYPKIMYERFLDHCRKQITAQDYISEESEVKFDVFATAYHYMIDDKA